ncbi:MAG: phage portal protein [Balneolaceae bacterium]
MSFFRNLFSIKPKAAQKRASFYEGGKKTAANRDFWNANSPFEDTAKSDRDTMRARSRWLAANNPIMSNIDNAIINNVIGKGIGLQSKTGDNKLDDEIERRFKLWQHKSLCDVSGRLSFADMQKIILANRMIDGEIFIYKKITKEGLKLQLIEADALDSNRGNSGMTLDKDGKVVKYHFTGKDGAIDINADSIINYYKCERPTQYRGVSEYKQAILDIKNFSAYQAATIQGARANAEIAYTIETERAAGDFTPISSTQDEDLHDINGLMVYYLRPGEKVAKHVNGHNGDGYNEFITSTVRTIAAARKISYELAFRDYSQVNFASSRASLIQDNKRFDDEQSHISTYFLDDVFMAWLEVEVLMGNLPISPMKWAADKAPYVAPKWSYPKRDWVDPVKNLKALEMEIALNLTTMTDECMAAGKDFEEILITKQGEEELMKQYGFVTPTQIQTEEAGLNAE